jgi:hypothetical protein
VFLFKDPAILSLKQGKARFSSQTNNLPCCR